MRIEAIDPIRMTDDDGTDLRMEPGDIKTVGENAGRLACTQGWAKDLDGNVATGEKSREAVTVGPQNVVVDPNA